MLRSVLLSIALLFTAAPGTAHEIRPTIADVEVGQDRVTMSMRVAIEALVAGIDLSAVENANDAPEAVIFDRLRALEPAALEEAFREAWPRIALGFLIEVDGEQLPPQIVSITIPSVGDVELPRDSILVVGADLPDGTAGVSVGLDASFGQFVPRQINAGEDAYQGFLEGGQMTPPLARGGPAAENSAAALALYFGVGFQQMTWLGLDHALFVLGLFFVALRAAPVATQGAAFSIALTGGVALGAAGLTTLPVSILGPLVALSLIIVGIDNVLGRSAQAVRIGFVLVCGLTHGLALAAALTEFGIAPDYTFEAVAGFTLGSLIGVTLILLVAFILAGWAMSRDWYRKAVAVPASLLIAAAGAVWLLERTLL